MNLLQHPQHKRFLTRALNEATRYLQRKGPTDKLELLNHLDGQLIDHNQELDRQITQRMDICIMLFEQVGKNWGRWGRTYYCYD